MSDWVLKYADARGEIHQQVTQAVSEQESRQLIVRRSRRVRPGDDERARRLPQSLVGDADDGGWRLGSGPRRRWEGVPAPTRSLCPPTAGHHGRGPSTDTRHDATRFINLCGIPDIFTPTGRLE